MYCSPFPMNITSCQGEHNVSGGAANSSGQKHVYVNKMKFHHCQDAGLRVGARCSGCNAFPFGAELRVCCSVSPCCIKTGNISQQTAQV